MIKDLYQNAKYDGNMFAMLRTAGKPLFSKPPSEPLEPLPGKPLLIVGASARAACQSELRRDRKPMAIDLYGDLDLARIISRNCRLAVPDYPGGIVETARSFPPAPFVYTGGLENHPRIVEALERERPNEGTPAGALRRVRDPFVLASVFRGHRIPAPRVASAPRHCDGEGVRWLSKPLRGCGGRGISALDEADDRAPCAGAPDDRYYQERIAGPSYSAVFEVECDSGDTRLLGMTRQLVGLREVAGGPQSSPFQYCGSVTLSSDDADLAHWRREFLAIGTLLTREFGLRGVFGVDAVFDGRHLRPVEVNPRYPASLEIIERATELRASSKLELHVAKLILFAPHSFVFPHADAPGTEMMFAADDVSTHFPGISALCDVPAPFEVIESGGPILTCVSTPWSSPTECGRHGLPPRFLANVQALRSRILAHATRRREMEVGHARPECS